MPNNDNGNSKNNKGTEPTFKEWLFEGKGTISEPWPTLEELLEDKEVQSELKKLEKASPTSKKSI